MARISLSFDAWRAGRVAPATLEVPTVVHTVVESPELKATLRGFADPISNLAVSPDGRTAAITQSQAGLVSLWDIPTRTARAACKSEWGVPYRLAFAPDGNTLAVAYFLKEGKGGGVGLWDVASGKQVAMLRRDEAARVYGLAYASDGKLIAASEVRKDANETRTDIVLWNVATRTVHSVWPLKEVATILAFSADGTLFVPVLALSDGQFSGSQIRRWNAATGKEVAALKDENRDPNPIHLMALSPAGKLVAGSSGKEIFVWELARGQRPMLRKEFPRTVHALAFAPDGKTLALALGNSPGAAHEPGQIALWDTSSDREPIFLGGHRSMVWCVAFAPDGRTLLSGGQDRTVRIWDVGSLVSKRAAARGP